MNVPSAQGGGVEGIGTQDLAVGGDYQGVVMVELVADFGDIGRLTQGQAVGVCEFRDGGFRRPTSPTLPGIRLRDYESHLVGGGDQAFQDGRCEVGGTREGYLQGSALLGEQALPPLAHGGLA